MSNPQALADVLAALAEVSNAHDLLASAEAHFSALSQKLADAVAQLQPPPPPPPPPAVKTLLAALQQQIGPQTVGVYTGIETHADAPAQFAPISENLKTMGADFALVKMGEGAGIWHNGDFSSIRAEFVSRGLGCAPYWYCLPQGGQAQIDACCVLAQQFGLVVLDCEDEYAGHDVELAALLNGIKARAPDALRIVSGYGDPITRFGPHGWPHHTVATAGVVYQPQAYFGVWQVYADHGVNAALQWCDNECASAFGASIVLQPAINVQGVRSLSDFEAAGAYWRPFGAGVVIWEYEQVTAEIVAAVRKGLSA